MEFRRSWRAGLALLAVAAAVGVAAGCGGGEDEAEATQELCTSLNEFGTAVGNLRSLSVGSTVDEWESARDEVRSAWDNVRDQAGDVQEARFDEVEAAYDELDSAIDDVPGDATAGQAVQEVAPQVSAVDTAWDGYYSQLGCS